MHRVQRVPVTESQGRVHTSAAGVLVYPEAEEVGGPDRRDRPAHRRLPVVRHGRPERQHHRLRGAHHPPAHRHRRHLPEREDRSCRTRAGDAHPGAAARLQALAEEQAAAPRRRPTGASQVRTVDRSERIRTYNFPENRISDHRIGYKAYNLDQVLDGDLDALLDALRRRRQAVPAAAGMMAPAAAGDRPRPPPLAEAGIASPASTPRCWPRTLRGTDRGAAAGSRLSRRRVLRPLRRAGRRAGRESRCSTSPVPPPSAGRP